MPEKVIIFGKDTCPYTNAAREDYAKKGYVIEYINVKASLENMEKMLLYSGGKRNVPVIVDNGKVVIGFGST